MITIEADPVRIASDIAGKRLASNLGKQHDCACKKVEHWGKESNDNAMEENTQDHGKEANTSNTKKLKRYKGFAIDINKVPHHDESDLESPRASKGKRSASYRDLSLENQTKELEIDAKRLKLEKQRTKWASANLRKNMELERMRLENKRMELANNQLRVKIKRRALELGFKLDMI